MIGEKRGREFTSSEKRICARSKAAKWSNWIEEAARADYKTSNEQAAYAAAKKETLDETFRKGTGTNINWNDIDRFNPEPLERNPPPLS